MNYEPEKIIITVEHKNKKISLDMELPTKVPINILRSQILDILKNLYPDDFINYSSFRLACDNKILNVDETLITAGIYDGSILRLIN